MEYFITQKTQHSIVEVAAALTQSIKFAAVAQVTSTSTQPSWRNRESVANKSPSLSNDNRCGFPFFLHLLRLVRNTSSATRLFSLPCWRCVTCPGTVVLAYYSTGRSNDGGLLSDLGLRPGLPTHRTLARLNSTSGVLCNLAKAWFSFKLVLHYFIFGLKFSLVFYLGWSEQPR